MSGTPAQVASWLHRCGWVSDATASQWGLPEVREAASMSWTEAVCYQQARHQEDRRCVR